MTSIPLKSSEQRQNSVPFNNSSTVDDSVL